MFQVEEAWHSSESQDSDEEDAASSAGNSGSISQPSTPAPPPALDDAFIPGVRSLRRRLVINDNRTVGSKSRKRPATEMQESAATKLAKTMESQDREAVRHLPVTAENRPTPFSAQAGPKQRSMHSAAAATSRSVPHTQRAVLRIAQPDGTVCFLAIDNVSDISRLPVTAVVQQLLASQKQASANSRPLLGVPMISRSAGVVPGFLARASVPQITTVASPAPPVLPLAATMSVPTTSQPVCLPSGTTLSQKPSAMLSVPQTSASIGTLPSLAIPSLPVLRPQKPSPVNSLSLAINRARSQHAMNQLFQNQAVSLPGLAAHSVNSQQLLSSIMAIRGATLSSATTAASSSTCHMVPVVADQSVTFAVPAAVTMPSKTPSTSVTTLSPQPSLSVGLQLLNSGQSRYSLIVPSSTDGQKLLLLSANSQAMRLGSVTAASLVNNVSGGPPNRTPLLVNLIASNVSAVPSETSGSSSIGGPVFTLSSAQQITSSGPSTCTVSSLSDVANIPRFQTPGILRRAVTESTLSLAMRAAVAAGRAPNVLSPLNRPQQQSRYVNNLTVKTLLENRGASAAESVAPSSAAVVTCSTSGSVGCLASSVVLNSTVIKPPPLSSSRSGLLMQTTAIHRTNSAGSTSVGVSAVPMSSHQLAGQPVLALMPAGVSIGPARMQQLVAVTTASVSVAKPTVALVSIAQLSLTSQGVAARPSFMSRNVDVGALQAIIPHSKSRAPPSRPARNNTRTTSVMKAPISALPRLTDLGLVTTTTATSGDRASASSSSVLTTAISPVNMLASPSAAAVQIQTPIVSAALPQIQAPSISAAVSATPGVSTLVSSASVAVLGTGNKPVVMAAGTSPLVLPRTSTPGQVFLLQSAGGGLVQLVQLPAANQSVATTCPSALNQQIVLAPNFAAAGGNALQLFAVSSTPAAKLSRTSSSVPIVQFVMCSSSSNVVSTSQIGVHGTDSVATAALVSTSMPPPVYVVSQQTAVASAPQSFTGPSQLPVTERPTAFGAADLTRPSTQPCGLSPQQSAKLQKSSGLAEAADLFLMAAGVVDRATASGSDVDHHSTTTADSAVISASSSMTLQTTR